MHFSARQDVRLKKKPRSKLFLSTVFKHGLLEGSTILLKYSAITHTPLESSRLGELKYAISAGEDIRPKIRAMESAKMAFRDERTWSLYCWQVQTGTDRFGQVRTGVKCYFTSTRSRTLSKFGPPPKPACSFLTVPRWKLYDPLKW